MALQQSKSRSSWFSRKAVGAVTTYFSMENQPLKPEMYKKSIPSRGFHPNSSRLFSLAVDEVLKILPLLNLTDLYIAPCIDLTPSLIGGGHNSVTMSLGDEFKTFNIFKKQFYKWCSEYCHIADIVHCSKNKFMQYNKDRSRVDAGPYSKIEYKCINKISGKGNLQKCPMQVKIDLLRGFNKYMVTKFCPGLNHKQIVDRRSASFSKARFFHDLNEEDIRLLEGGHALSDRHIDFAQKLLSKMFPNINGFIHPLKIFNPFSYLKGYRNLIQIIYLPPSDPNEVLGHWLTISTINCTEKEIKVYDSGVGETSSLKDVIAEMFYCSDMQLTYVACPKQEGDKDCGLFAIYFAYFLCCGIEISKQTFNQAHMRKELSEYLKNNIY